MSNEARDISIREVLETFESIHLRLIAMSDQGKIDGQHGQFMEAAARLTAIVMRENGENTRANELRETLYHLQNDLAARVDEIRKLADAIAGHVLEV